MFFLSLTLTHCLSVSCEICVMSIFPWYKIVLSICLCTNSIVNVWCKKLINKSYIAGTPFLIKYFYVFTAFLQRICLNLLTLIMKFKISINWSSGCGDMQFTVYISQIIVYLCSGVCSTFPLFNNYCSVYVAIRTVLVICFYRLWPIYLFISILGKSKGSNENIIWPEYVWF